MTDSVVVAANQSDQAVVAISAAWRMVDAAGKEKRFRQKCDTFLPAGAGKVVVAANSTLYLGPSTCVAERSPSADLAASVAWLERRTFEGLGDISEIHIAVDAILFERGEMYAADTAYADAIEARVGAAQEVVAYVRSALERGQARREAASGLSAASGGRLGERGAWIRDFAKMLSCLPNADFDAYVDALGRLRAPGIRVTGRA